MTIKMQRYVFILLAVILNTVLLSSQVQLQSEFYQLTDSAQANSVYFSTIKNKRQRNGRIKTVQTYDEFICLQNCLRLPEDCIAVNFMKKTVNSIHSCELLSFEGKLWDSSAFDDNSDFDFFVVKNSQFQNCEEMFKKLQMPNGVYRIRPRYSASFLVYCNTEASSYSWTVIQRRKNGLVDFSQTWDGYKNGFGKLNGEHWLGLEKIHAMTSQGSYRLQVSMVDFDENSRSVEYGVFRVAGEDYNYRLTVGQFTGNAGDSLSYHNNAPFSTKDRDNDNAMINCAQSCHGGWWYKHCHETNPNGLYLNGLNNQTDAGVTWKTWLGQNYSLKIIRLKIRPN